MPIYLSKTSQVQRLNKPILAALQWDKTLTKTPSKYSNFADVFWIDLVIELLKNTGMNEHTIKLIEGKQLPYGPFYALSSVDLETLKTYIKSHLETGFIQPSKSLVDALILFDKKPNYSFRLYVNY